MYLRKEKTASGSQSWKSLWNFNFQLLKIPSTWWSKTSEIKLPYHSTCKRIWVQKLKRNIPSLPIMPEYMITLSNYKCSMLRNSFNVMRSSESLIKFHWFHIVTNNIWNELIIFIMLGEAIIFFLHTYNNWPILDVLASFFVELLICVLKCNIKQWPNEIFVMFSSSMMCVCVWFAFLRPLALSPVV